MRKAIFIKGKLTFKELSEEELAASQLNTIIWHREKPFRVTVNNDVWKDWFAKKRDHADYLELTGQLLYPDLMELLYVVRLIDNSNIVNDSENTYVYLDEVFDYHLTIIAKYNAIVEQKPTNQ